MLTVKPQRPVRLVSLRVRDAVVTSAVVAGRGVPKEFLDGFGVLFHAPPPAGLTVTLVLATPGPVTLRVLDGSDGLTDLPGFRPRPEGIGVEGSHDSELVVVARTYTI